MSLSITPEAVAALYDALRQFQPFAGWNLPEADAIEFHVVRTRKVYGTYHYGDDHAITVSESVVGHWDTLSQTVAHEMIHLHQAMRGTQSKAEHNHEFRRLAMQVCAAFGFDERCF
jgi:hypothetical protein